MCVQAHEARDAIGQKTIDFMNNYILVICSVKVNVQIFILTINFIFCLDNLALLLYNKLLFLYFLNYVFMEFLESSNYEHFKTWALAYKYTYFTVYYKVINTCKFLHILVLYTIGVRLYGQKGHVP